MVRSHTPVLGRRFRSLAAIALALFAIPLVAAVVFAHNPEITASENCDGIVSFTSTAWVGDGTGAALDASRTNAKIGISWSSDGGTTWTDLPDNSAYHFDAANGYTFSGSFDAGDAATVIVRARALVNWANGYTPIIPDDDRQTGPITKPDDCAPPSEPPSESPSGSVGGETGRPRVTPPSTSLVADGSSSNGGGLQIVLVAIAGLAAFSLMVVPASRKARKR